MPVTVAAASMTPSGPGPLFSLWRPWVCFGTHLPRLRRRRSGCRRCQAWKSPFRRACCRATELRLAGQGEPGDDELRAGDLYLTLVIAAHPLYQLKGRDLHFAMPVVRWR